MSFADDNDERSKRTRRIKRILDIHDDDDDTTTTTTTTATNMRESMNHHTSTRFNEITESIKAQLHTGHTLLATLTSNIETLHTRREAPNLRSKLHSNLERTSDVMQEISRLLKLLSEMSTEQGLKRREHDVRRTTEMRLAKDFHNFRDRFVEVSKLAKKKRNPQTSGGELNNSKFGEGGGDVERGRLLREEGLDDVTTLTAEDMGLQNELTFNHAVINEKYDVVTAIHEDMLAVQEMYEDLAVIVDDQGTFVSIIDENVNMVSDDVIAARDEIHLSRQYQRRKRNRMCCFLLIFLVACVVFTFLYSHFVLNSSN